MGKLQFVTTSGRWLLLLATGNLQRAAALAAGDLVKQVLNTVLARAWADLEPWLLESGLLAPGLPKSGTLASFAVACFGRYQSPFFWDDLYLWCRST